jgi:hypothetical protein
VGHSISRRQLGGRLWFGAAALLALPLCIDATSDPDLWWHLRLGQWIADNHSVAHTELFSYTAAGAAQVDHEWLAELLFSWVHNAVGLAGLAVAVGLVTWSGLLALAWTARQRGAGGFSTGLVLLLGAKAIQPVTGTRPQMLTFALLCWSLLLLDRHLRRGGRGIWLLMPLFLLWANLHAGFVVALGILAVALLASAADARWRHAVATVPRRRHLLAAVVLAACAAVALVNPNGPDLYRFALLGSDPSAHQLIQEWQRTDFTAPASLALAALIVATALTMALNRARLRISAVVLFVIGTAAAILVVRNIAIAVALLSPTLAELLPLRYRLPTRPVMLPLLGVAAALAAVVVSVARTAGDTSDTALARQWPSCLVSDLQGTHQSVRLWLPYGQAGRAIDQAWPEVRVYAYGNDAALGGAIIVSHVRIATGSTAPPTALALLQASGTQAVITPPGPLAAQLGSAGWHAVAQSNGELLLTAPSFPHVPVMPCTTG